jgi:hypothetical protein
MKIERRMRRPRIVRAGIVLCAAMAAIPAQAAKPSIGVTSLVVQHVEGTSEQRTRRLALRDPVHQDEVVVTGEQSASEMHLIDDTRVTVGPSSKVVLDRFVYDPDPGKGALVLQATEGVFRFFSGNMASSNYAIETPSVTVGIRGTIFVGAIRSSDGTFALILESRNSEVSVTGRSGETVVLSAPGQAAIARADGSVTSGPAPDWAVAMVERMDGVIVKASTDDALSGPDRDVDVAGLTDPAPASEPRDEEGLPGLSRALANHDPDAPPGDPDETGDAEASRGLPRALSSQNSDSLPGGLEKAANENTKGWINGQNPSRNNQAGNGDGHEGADGADGADDDSDGDDDSDRDDEGRNDNGRGNGNGGGGGSGNGKGGRD